MITTGMRMTASERIMSPGVAILDDARATPSSSQTGPTRFPVEGRRSGAVLWLRHLAVQLSLELVGQHLGHQLLGLGAQRGSHHPVLALLHGPVALQRDRRRIVLLRPAHRGVVHPGPVEEV